MSPSSPNACIARIRTATAHDATPLEQTVEEHLCAVAEMTAHFASKAGLPLAGRLVGLLHDLGKYSTQFQRYIFSANGRIPQDSPDYLDAARHKGRIDHSTAGAQYVWNHFKGKTKAQPWAQMLALCIASHHSGLLDCIDPDGKDVFQDRMDKSDSKTHLQEVQARLDTAINTALGACLSNDVLRELYGVVTALRMCEQSDNTNCRDFQQGLLARFLLSCLLDADRTDSADFEYPQWKAQRARMPRCPWTRLVPRLESHLAGMEQKYDIDTLRRDISDQCARRAKDAQGLFTLTVPTGGGKTLASLRFALRHAQEHGLERIIYVVPYTSIIDQNAQTTREILEVGEEPGAIVLEHHSNLAPTKKDTEEDSEKECDANQWEKLAENWEAPVIFTTMVQFLESLFGSGTRSARRMHNLAKSVLIFDEIQTLPVRCVHMFCNALNFLVDTCGSSAVLCTATQPCLDQLRYPQRGSLRLDPKQEIMDNVPQLFANLKRTEFFNHCDTYMDSDAVVALALDELQRCGSCLVVCNTKSWAEKVYMCCREQWNGSTYYLSTNLCPAHRMKNLAAMRAELKTGVPVLCVSTQLIECGVDISFKSVIRLAAGLDSILQAAGRCNRHGGSVKGRVHVVKAREESERLDSLPDIKAGRDIFLDNVCVGYAKELEEWQYDFTQPELIKSYFEHYFHRRASDMEYNVDNGVRRDCLLSMLGSNSNAKNTLDPLKLAQSFATATRLFQVIDAPTQAVIVPYEEQGRKIIADICSADIFHRRKELLRQAQRYSVNVFSNIFTILSKQNALHNIQQSGIMALQEPYYSTKLGVVTQPTGFSSTPCF